MSTNPTYSDGTKEFYLPSRVDEFILMVYEAPLDNSYPIEIEIQSDDYTLSAKAAPHLTEYQLGLQVTFPLWPSVAAIEYWASDADEDAKQNITFQIRDYCLGPMWTDEYLTIEQPYNLLSVDSYNTDVSNGKGLFIYKNVLMQSTTFYLNYLNYTKYNNTDDDLTTELGVDCGWIQYRVYDLDQNQEMFDLGIILVS